VTPGAFDDVLSDIEHAAANGFVELNASSSPPPPPTADEAAAAAAAATAAAAAAATAAAASGGLCEGFDVAMLAVRHPGAVWAPGLAVEEDMVERSSAYDSNRVEVS
jgi:hypothetical protein